MGLEGGQGKSVLFEGSFPLSPINCPLGSFPDSGLHFLPQAIGELKVERLGREEGPPPTITLGMRGGSGASCTSYNETSYDTSSLKVSPPRESDLLVARGVQEKSRRQTFIISTS